MEPWLPATIGVAMYNAPYQGVANHLAGYGRYGDSMLVHMNPIEVQMLASLSPTGRLTVNPMTGQQEAFLPFLAPLLGSFLGNAALGSTLAGALGSKALGAAAASALGSAAATTAVTGDLEQGIMSGITGFGIGSALGGLGELAKAGSGVAEATAQAGTQAATQAAADATSQLVPQVAEGFGAAVNPMADLAAQAVPTVAEDVVEGFGASMSPGAFSPTSRVMAGDPTFAERFAQPFQRPGEFFSQLTKPGSFLPMYVGESGRMAREMELAGEGSMRDYEEEQEKQRQKTLGQIGSVYDRIRSAYPGVGYAQGGIIERYVDGGMVDDAINQYLNRAAIPNAEDVQLSLRGQYALTPPAASYSALDVGGEGYLPGVAQEFKYFTDVDPNAPPPPATPPGGGGDQQPPGGGDGQRPPWWPPDAPWPPNFDFDMGMNFGGGMRGFNEYAFQNQENPFEGYSNLVNMYGRRDEAAPAAGAGGGISDYDSKLLADLLQNQSDYAGYVPDFGFRFADGGMTPAPEDMTGGNPDNELVMATVSAIRGEIENADQIIKMFVEKYGSDVFMQLRDQVLQEIVPGAQTQGMIEGEGGGQDDMVEGMIGSQRPVAVSPGEYIVPADVVSLAGGGYSGDGAKFFDGLVDDIRQKTMGSTQQIRPYK